MDVSRFPEVPESMPAHETLGDCSEDKAAFKEEACDMAGKSRPDSRAWIELSASALERNVAFLRSRLPKSCRLMPAVKAEAYGHGAVIISRLLNCLDVDAFSVACVSEGIALREAGIKGEILVLGYTSPADFPLLRRYHLIQTVADYPYAEELDHFGQTLHVHIGIDTGMRRLGIRCEDMEEIKAVCKMENLIVDGLFTHLPVSDSSRPQDRAFTEGQVRAFYQMVDALRSQGFSCSTLHLLASYGIMNLLWGRSETVDAPARAEKDGISDSMLAADYVRPGIALYGMLSTREDSRRWQDLLHPVLSLKAKVASVRMLYAGESAGYGLAFTAKEDMRIATIAIGYADGLPRALSHGNGSVLIDGCKAPIIGRICMDQTLVDVSGIPRIQSGDIAVIIGKSGTLEITAGDLAEQCGTITNEILSRLGSRLDRILA